MADDEFVDAFFETALWSSNDESDESGGEPMDANYDVDDFDEASYQGLRREAEEFRNSHWGMIKDDLSRAGHDFWLTRNDHGAGFWDGDWPEPDATALTKDSKTYGGVDLYIGDDGKVYASGYERTKMPTPREKMVKHFFQNGSNVRPVPGWIGLPSWKGRR